MNGNFIFGLNFQEEEESEEAPSVERRTSRGYQFRQRHLSNIMSTIEAREKEEGKEGETQRVRLLLVYFSRQLSLIILSAIKKAHVVEETTFITKLITSWHGRNLNVNICSSSSEFVTGSN